MPARHSCTGSLPFVKTHVKRGNAPTAVTSEAIRDPERGEDNKVQLWLASWALYPSKQRMPEWVAIVLLGIIEGITEFIPVSSTGHLLLAEHWLPKQSDLFNIVIQCGAVLAVLPLFPRRLESFLRWRDPGALDYLIKIAAAFIITGAGGFILDKKGFKLPEQILPVAIALFAGGICFLLVEWWIRGRSFREDISWGIVVAVGVGQLIAAVFPGTSRSGATILLALAMGLSRPAATEFSFLVGIPTMLAAGSLKILKQLHHASGGVHENWSMVLLGTIVAAVVSFVVVKWFLRFVQTHTFAGFGWYRIALGLGMLLLVH
jgi:undecaprenyl-diphosphatase